MILMRNIITKEIKEMDNKVVYIHRKKTNGEVFYVGMGNKDRPYQSNLGDRSIFWHKVVNKHGHSVEIIKEGLTKRAAFDLEIKLIKKYGRRDKGLGTLVNLTDGGDSGTREGKECYNIDTGVIYNSLYNVPIIKGYSKTSLRDNFNGRTKFNKNIPIRLVSNPYPDDAMEEGTVYLNELDNIELIEGYSYRPYNPNDYEQGILNKFNNLYWTDQDLIIESYYTSMRHIQKMYPMINYSYAQRQILKSIKEILGKDFEDKYNNTRKK